MWRRPRVGVPSGWVGALGFAVQRPVTGAVRYQAPSCARVGRLVHGVARVPGVGERR